VGFLGSLVAIVMGGIKTNRFELDHAFLLCASSLVTASLASFVLGKWNVPALMRLHPYTKLVAYVENLCRTVL
jgi:hypothetical protein